MLNEIMYIKWNDVLLEVVMQKEINLKVLLDIIKKRLSLILIITAILTILSGIYGMFSGGPPPIYQSSASILLNMDERDDMNALEVVLRDPAVLNQVIQELGLTVPVADLNKQITFSNDGGKIVKIMATHTNPEMAANITNSTAFIFTKQVGNILGIYDTKIVSEAQPSSTPFIDSGSPSLIKNIVIGFGIGLVLSIGVVLFLDSLDETVQSEREIEQILGIPAIGSVSKMNSKNMKSAKIHKTG